MRTTILIIFLGLGINFYGQDTIDNKLCFKLAPLSLIDPYSGSSIRIGTEYKLKGRTSLYNEIGTYFPSFNGLKNNNGIILKTEFKFYFNHDAMTSGSYISGELFYKYQSFSTWDTIQIKPDYRQEYTVSKNVECFTIKFGAMEVYKNHLIFDFFIGAGVRVKQIKNTLTTDENNKIQSDGDYGTNLAIGMAGQSVYPNIDMGIKIGYRIK